MLWKCCTQYASKFGKLSSGHRTGKTQFSFQSQRRAMRKSVQATIQLSSSRMIVRFCSKSFKLGFTIMWLKNFQIYKLDLEKAEESEIKFTNLFPGGSNGKVSTCNTRDQGLIPGSGRFPGEGNSNPLQYSCLENPMDRGAWQATVHRVTQSQTRLKWILMPTRWRKKNIYTRCR